MLQGRGHERLALLEASTVNSDANGDSLRLRRTGHSLNTIPASDIARVQPQRLNPMLYRRKRASVVKMDVRDKRHGT